jgi:hypothetical protein
VDAFMMLVSDIPTGNMSNKYCQLMHHEWIFLYISTWCYSVVTSLLDLVQKARNIADELKANN